MSDTTISHRLWGKDRDAGLPVRRLRMAGDAAAVRDARSLVAEALLGADDELRDAAVLLADEVVTNAVVHGGGWFLLQVDAGPETVRIEVTDANAAQPRVLQASGEREHGRGLAIVDTLATRWGTEHLGTHKIVWFELDPHPGGDVRQRLGA